MDNKEYVLTLFQEGLLCDCRTGPIWDRLYDSENNFIGYELQHKPDCMGRVKAAETLKELANEVY